MKKLLVASVISTMALSSFGMAQGFDQYVSAKGVWSYATDKFEMIDSDSFKKSKGVVGLRIAYGLSIPLLEDTLRTELEYGYNGKVKFTIDGDSSEMKSQTLMLNAYYDFNTGTEWTPYVGAGLGYARLKNEFSNPSENQYASKSKGNFAWNVSAGTAYAINRDVAVDLSYRFTDYGKVNHDDHRVFTVKKSKQRANELNLGIRYRF